MAIYDGEEEYTWFEYKTDRGGPWATHCFLTLRHSVLRHCEQSQKGTAFFFEAKLSVDRIGGGIIFILQYLKYIGGI